MTGAPVNLNRFRKKKARDEQKNRAARNVVKFGRTKVAKDQNCKQVDTTARDLDGHKIDP